MAVQGPPLTVGEKGSEAVQYLDRMGMVQYLISNVFCG